LIWRDRLKETSYNDVLKENEDIFLFFSFLWSFWSRYINITTWSDPDWILHKRSHLMHLICSRTRMYQVHLLQRKVSRNLMRATYVFSRKFDGHFNMYINKIYDMLCVVLPCAMICDSNLPRSIHSIKLVDGYILFIISHMYYINVIRIKLYRELNEFNKKVDHKKL